MIDAGDYAEPIGDDGRWENAGPERTYEVMLAASPPAPMSEWQPIETAPRPDETDDLNETPILVWDGEKGYQVVSWGGRDWPVWDNWLNGAPYGLGLYFKPKFWMPITASSPAAPETKKPPAD